MEKQKGTWVKGVLTLLRVPKTPANQKFLWGWWQVEGGGHGPYGNIAHSAKFNWLNTAKKMYRSYNHNILNERTGYGVQNYRHWLQGVRATVRTLKNGHYPDILEALESGDPFKHRPLDGLSIWLSGKPVKDNPRGLRYAEKVLGIGSKWNL